MTRELSTERLDELAAQAIAGVEAEAAQLAEQATFAAMMEEVEKVPLHRREYTGAEFFLRHPEKFRAVIGYIAEGHGHLWIAKRVGCSHHTVRACRDRFPKSVAIEKERLAGRFETAAALLVDRIIENPEIVPGSAIALSAAMMTDKSLLLRGGATIITGKERTFNHEDYARLVEGAIEVESSAQLMGSTWEKALQMAGKPAAPAPAAAQAAAATPGAGMDAESPASPTQGETAATLAATRAPERAAEDRGGGGRASPAGGASDVA